MQKKLEDQLNKTKDYFKKEILKIRGNRANPQLIEDMQVEAYNSNMKVNQLATVSVADPTLITIQVWDKSVVDAVKKAIQESDLNVNPVTDGNIIRVPLPPLTEERREELVKVVKKLSEEVKISARNTRREYLHDLESKNLSEDELDRSKKEVQKTMDDFNAYIDQEFEKKKDELLTI